LSNLVSTKLAITINSINEADRYLRNRIAHRLGQNHQLHLENVALTLHLRNDVL